MPARQIAVTRELAVYICVVVCSFSFFLHHRDKYYLAMYSSFTAILCLMGSMVGTRRIKAQQ